VAVKAFMQAGGNERLQLEALPAYAPDLNPLDTGYLALAKECRSGQRLHHKPGRTEKGNALSHPSAAPQTFHHQSQLY
jgi:hypothetical protein